MHLYFSIDIGDAFDSFYSDVVKEEWGGDKGQFLFTITQMDKKQIKPSLNVMNHPLSFTQ